MFFPSSNTKPAEKNKKAARILLPAARTTLEHLNSRTVRLFVVFTVLSLLLCRLICILLIPRCEPTLIMYILAEPRFVYRPDLFKQDGGFGFETACHYCYMGGQSRFCLSACDRRHDGGGAVPVADIIL